MAGVERGPSLTRRLVLWICALAALWLGGFLQFVADLPRDPANAAGTSDAIVVLTGGAERIAEGLALLEAGRAKRMLISGVDRGTGLADLRRQGTAKAKAETFACCVTLGHEAQDTKGNAVEAAIWMRETGYGSLLLVTASYHMPRGELYFRARMPNVRILTHPVFPPTVPLAEWWRHSGTARLLAEEFNKYLLALVTVRLAGAEEGETGA